MINKLPRNVAAASTRTSTGLGAIGIWLNGVSIYNAADGISYNNAGVWNRDAYIFEAVSFDSCNGHPQQQGVYHIHINPNCLYDYTASSKHSPIIGFLFDGAPIYGPYGYSVANNPASGISRMTSSYLKKSSLSVTGRTNGPAVDSTYPLGSFLEDYEYSNGLGSLDEYNGRWCVTPEYPNGVIKGHC